MSQEQVIGAVAKQAVYAAGGAALGAAAHEAIKPRSGGSQAPIAMQVGSAMGAAAVGGAGVSGTLAAGAAVVTAKVAVVTAAATVAAPFVVGAAAVGAVGYGFYKFCEWLDS